ncbi:MAG: ferritin family protein [Nitrospiraceae bacterium]|nr:ferritin family protein [Nitrospiraceae bacterium]
MTAIELAVKMETDAIKFYKEAADKTKNPIGKKMFLSIMADEERHLEMLSKIFKGLDISNSDTTPMRNIKTIFELMKDAMLKRVEATNYELDAFKVSMTMENEGINFYKKALSEAKKEKEKLLFKRLISEEEEHYNIFSNTYSFMLDTGNWFMWDEHSIVDGGTPWA